MFHRAIAAFLMVFAFSVGVRGQEDQKKLAIAGTAIAKSHCYRCHGETFNGNAQLNIMDPAALIEHGYVVPGDAENSPLWQRVVSDEMPPSEDGIVPLTDTEKLTLREWIDAGAPQVRREVRPMKTYASVIEDIHRDLLGSDREDRPYYRYFTLTHLNNNYRDVSDFDLRLYRAAFSKAINSLSYEPDIYIPTFIDSEQTVFRIDIRRLGWTTNQWKFLLSQYPYGFHYQNSDDRALANLDEQIDVLSGTNLSWLRADWFINYALRPAIYHHMLGIPHHTQTLEQKLNVDFERNFKQNRLARAGFAASGVSIGNRLVERHSALHGYYWKSYDFKDKGTAGNLFRFPLGPVFKGNDYPNLAFRHDGGEMIFSLPNGLQAYMLCDDQGNRINQGPIEVVRDSTQTSGTPLVVNGLSCVHCHRHGMIDFRDTVRTGVGVFDAAKRKVQNLYPQPDEMARIIEGDRRRFLNALQQAIGPFLLVGEDAGRPIEAFAEPVGAIARLYQRDLDVHTAAIELGINDPATLATIIGHNRQLIGIGLGPLSQNAGIQRADWENTAAFVSPFQETIRILGIATPTN